MQVTVNLIRYIEEDGVLKRLTRKMKVSMLCGSFVVEIPNGCCSSPFKIGQSIRLKPSCNAILIEKETNITYDVSSKTWNIILPLWYLPGNFDRHLSRIMKDYGFDKNEAVLS